MKTLSDLVSWLDESLLPVCADPEQRIAERNLLIEHFLKLSPAARLATPDLLLSDPKGLDALYAALNRRVQDRVPLQYLLGETMFYGLPFTVSSAVLIPRPETELLVEAAISFALSHPVQSIVDLGTGSGCIAIALKTHLSHSEVLAVDVSPDALAVASANAEKNRVCVKFIQSDWFAALEDEAPFDLIVSNPPYIAKEDAGTLSPEVLQEPHTALFPPKEPESEYHRLLTATWQQLSPQGGAFFFEMGLGQSRPLIAQATELGFTAVKALPDYAGIPRVLTGRRMT